MSLAFPAWLLNHLWQSTVCAVVAWLLTLSFRQNRAAVRYRIWLAASVKFLVPFSLFVGLGNRLGPIVTASASKAVMTPIAASAGPSDSARLQSEPPAWILGRIAEPFPRAVPAPSAASDVPDPMLRPKRLLEAGVAVWLLGLAVNLMLWLRQWLRVRATLRAAAPLELDVPAMIPALSSPASIEPSVFGIFRPVLLLPKNITTELSADEIEAILLHESAHVDRHDNLAAALHMTVESVFWFNPVVWWIGKRLVEERERACDEQVLNGLVQPETYAEAILNVCKLHLKTPLICAAGVASSNLRERIEAIMNYRTPWNLGSGKKLLLVGIGVAALCVPVFVGMLNARQVSPQPGAQTPFTFSSIDAPGASSTTARGIDGLGRIVGSFVDTSGTHGFLYAGGSFSTIDFPGSRWTVAMGINSIGQIVGGYGTGADTGNHGFMISGGAFSSFDFPGSQDTIGYGLNNRGQIVGTYLGNDGLRHGFRLSGGNYSLIEAPDSHGGSAHAINDAGDIVGLSGSAAAATAFLFKNGLYSKVQPSENGYTDARGLNSLGDIVGQAGGPQGLFRGFLRSSERAAGLDLPDAVTSWNAQGINDLGQIVGEFADRTGTTHGYLATPTTLNAGPVDPSAGNLITLLNGLNVGNANTSGATAVQGPTGPQGPAGPQGPPGPPALEPEPLDATRILLVRAAAALNISPAFNKGGYLEKSIADAKTAIALVDVAMGKPPDPSVLNQDGVRLVATATTDGPPDFTVPAGEQDRNPNMDSALKDLAKAWNTFAKASDSSLRGHRQQINDSIASAANNVIAGIRAGKAYREAGLPGGGGRGATAPRGTLAPRGTPATVTAGNTDVTNLSIPGPIREFKVTGLLTGESQLRQSGRLLQTERISLVLRETLPGQPLGRLIQSVLAPDGSFEFRSVKPGTYSLSIVRATGDRGGIGPTMLTVLVVDRDISGLTIDASTSSQFVARPPR